MPQDALSITGDMHFKIRFNTAHGDTDFYWHVIVTPLPGAEEEQEYLARSVHCKVDTYSE